MDSLLALLSKPKFRIGISALSGLLAYGLWALFINGGPSSPEAWRAAGVQGVYSFIITLFFSSSIEWMVKMITFYPKTLCFAFTGILLFIFSYTVHLINGTPHPMLTLIPSYLVSMILTLGYLFGMGFLKNTSIGSN